MTRPKGQNMTNNYINHHSSYLTTLRTRQGTDTGTSPPCRMFEHVDTLGLWQLQLHNLQSLVWYMFWCHVQTCVLASPAHPLAGKKNEYSKHPGSSILGAWQAKMIKHARQKRTGKEITVHSKSPKTPSHDPCQSTCIIIVYIYVNSYIYICVC